MFLIRHMAGLLLAAAAGVYFYFYFRRIAELLSLRTESVPVRVGLIVLTVAFVLPAADVWGIWAVVVLYLLLFALLMELANVILRRMGKAGRGWKFLYRSGGLPILALMVTIGYGWWNMHHVVQKNYTVYTDKELREDGYRVALLSDLHYKTVQDEKDLVEIAARISRERPDLVVLCGDIVDEFSTGEEMREVFRCLSGIRSEYGTYYVYGNHDRGRYVKEHAFTEEELAQAITDAGIRILRDSSVRLNHELTVIGRDDYSKPEGKKRDSAKRLKDNAGPEDFILLLDHQPRELKKNAELGFDLQLSGHTHGGQIWPIGELSSLLGFGEMNYGQKEIGDFQVIVTSGMAGWNYPLRTGKHSEYVIVDIVNPDKSK